ncbi:phage tail assembly protein T [Streptomyces cinereoruber]|uniref:phage tail assembly protein T n=1 Tax=Streptomyces cinereoruber TaxID=67260 RepID=UPI003637AA44
MERFTEEEMIRLVAYQNLYGPIGPKRMDAVAARLGMDVAAPHMKKGARPKFADHLVQWSQRARPRKTGRELLAAVKGIHAGLTGSESGRRARR